MAGLFHLNFQFPSLACNPLISKFRAFRTQTSLMTNQSYTKMQGYAETAKLRSVTERMGYQRMVSFVAYVLIESYEKVVLQLSCKVAIKVLYGNFGLDERSANFSTLRLSSTLSSG